MNMKNKEKLFDLRRAKRMTQKELAKQSGLTERTIANYEDDIEALRKAKYENVEKLANALGVSINEFFLPSTSTK